MYYWLFRTLFNILEEEFNWKVRWAHLSEDGGNFVGFTVDQDYKLLVGKLYSLYLNIYYI